MSHFGRLKIDTRKWWWNILDGIYNWNAYNKKYFSSRLSTRICFCQVWLYFVPVKYCPVSMKLCYFSLREPSVIKEQIPGDRNMENNMKNMCPTNSCPSWEASQRSPLLVPVQVQWKYLVRTNHCYDTERFLCLSMAELLPNPLFSCNCFGLYINISQEKVAILCMSDSILNLNDFFNYVLH